MMNTKISRSLFYLLLLPAACAAATGQLFVTSQRCIACHNGLTNADGEDISIGSQWRAAIMAHSAKDPYWQASVRRETIDHPSASAHIQDECASCHMPMMRYHELANGAKGQVFAHLPLPDVLPPLGVLGPVPSADLAADGVSCSMCHQIEADGLGTRASFTAGFKVNETLPIGERHAYGPFDVDPGRTGVMNSASGLNPVQAAHIQQAALCGSCHTLFTQSLDEAGNVIGELPEQVPFLEWRHSDYVDYEACQSCHMPAEREPAAISSVLGQPRDGVSRHSFRGGNFFMLSVFARHAAQLSVTAPRNELEGSIQRTREHLQTMAAMVSIDEAAINGDRLEASLTIMNLAGHKLPTAYPSRRAWIHFTVRDGDGNLVFESGRHRPDGSIVANDNDLDPSRYEPHFDRIESSSQVQIYEGILADSKDRVTTGLLRAVRYIKDNRLLPEGFDKTTASPDISVKGAANGDESFEGGLDSIVYAVPIGSAKGPFTVEAGLWYQPIAFRWARNLDDYDAPEPRLFAELYRQNADNSAIRLAADSSKVE